MQDNTLNYLYPRFVSGKTVRVLTVIICLLLAISCQKAEGPEEKPKPQAEKSVPSPAKSVIEDKAETPVKPETKSETEPRKQEEPSKVIASGKEATLAPMDDVFKVPDDWEFHEPVHIWEREFEPSLIDISEMNSAGEYIAVQGGGEYGIPTAILFLDRKGNTVREIPFDVIEKYVLPPDQVWLTYFGERWNNEEFKKSFKEGKEIMTKPFRAYVSGNGEYYGIVRYHPYIEPVDGSFWHDFSYYDKTGRLLWRAAPDVNYYFIQIHISYDGKRILQVDHAIEDYFGQKWYLYDEKGRLIKAEHHPLYGDVSVADEQAEWIIDEKSVKISNSHRYIATIHGKDHMNSKVSLRDGNGVFLWSRIFEETGHGSIRLIDNWGKIRISGSQNSYIVDRNGEVIISARRLDNYIQDISESGIYFSARWEDAGEWEIRVFGADKSDLLHKFKAKDLLGDKNIELVSSQFLSDDYILFKYMKPSSKVRHFGVLRIKDGVVVWNGEDILPDYTGWRKRNEYSRQLMFTLGGGSGIDKVFVFDIGGGNNERN